LHAAIFQYVASQLVSSEEEYQIREIFTLLDYNGDGTITRDELAKGIDIFRERFGLKGDIGDIDDIV
jgi:Ca2+-binding EF-hand superfamily protein